jgi:uncharacterized glyoxalase superfamily protein PhnB
MEAIIAELTVADVAASIYWYRELGFQVELEGLRDEDGLQWASLEHGGRTVWLLRADKSPYSAEHPPRTALYLQVADLDALYERLRVRGIATLGPPVSQWYGLREFALLDPDGFRWVINQPLSPEETPPPPPGPPGVR